MDHFNAYCCGEEKNRVKNLKWCKRKDFQQEEIL